MRRLRLLFLPIVLLVGGTATANIGFAKPTPRTTPVYPNLILPAAPFFQISTSFLPNKKVFAHYMVCCGAFFNDRNMATLEDAAKQDILMAQAMGIDGFALNLGGWSSPNYYATRAAAMFQAAQDLGTGFKLFFSTDMCCGLPASDIVSMMTTYAGHPNYFTKSGRPVLSTYDGGQHTNLAFWRDQVLAPLATAGYNVYFVPYFFPDPMVDPPTTAAIQSTVTYWSSQTRASSSASIIDGMFNFATAQLSYGASPNLIQNTGDYASALSSAGKTFMASFSPYYWGAYQTSAGRRNYNERGGKGMSEQFAAIQSANPDWMEIVTWNDWAESYMMPIDDFTKYFTWGYCMQNSAGNCIPTGWYQDHRGMAELVRYYIQWFKTGVQPTIVKDAVFYSYVPQMSNATITTIDPYGTVGQVCSGGSCWPYGLFGDSTDHVYMTVAMTAPGFVTWTSGSLHNYQAVPAGLSFVTGDSSPGTQVFSLSRGGVQINWVQGPDILNSLPIYNYWPATGYVEGPN